MPEDENPDAGLPVLHVSSMYGRETHKPIVILTYDGPGKEFNIQMTLEAARNHAQDILEVCESAAADAFLFEFVRDDLHAGDQAAAGIIQAFRVWRAEHRL